MSSPPTASRDSDWLAQDSSLLWLVDWHGGKTALGNTSPPTPGQQLQLANIHHPNTEHATGQRFHGRTWCKFCIGSVKGVLLVQKETCRQWPKLVEVVTWKYRRLKLPRKLKIQLCWCALQSEDGDGSVHSGHGAWGHDPRCSDGFLWNSPCHLLQVLPSFSSLLTCPLIHMLFSSSDRSVRIFDVKDGTQSLAASLVGHEGPVWQVAWAHPRWKWHLVCLKLDFQQVWKHSGLLLLWQKSSDMARESGPVDKGD